MSYRSGPVKAAFEVRKYVRQVMTLSEAEVEKHLDPRELLAKLIRGFRQLELGEIQIPPRPKLSVPDKGFCLAMPAWAPGMQVTVKIVSVFENNLEKNLPNHLAVINLFDPDTGVLSCVMDGTYITGIRTAASAVLSVEMLSRRESRIATVIGARVQAREHVRLLPFARELEKIHVCALRFEDAEKLAAQYEIASATTDVEAAMRQSDVVCLATHSATAVIRSEWIRAGTHVTSVGYHPPQGELPRELVIAHGLFVESLDAFQPIPVGCAELRGLSASSGTTLGAVALGRRAGRKTVREITVYKAMGVAMEDMVAANLVFQRAKQEDDFQTMNW